MADLKWTIYMHRNKINGKVYIGQTYKNPKDRWLNGNGYKNQVFYRAIEKYGWDNFEHIILEENLTQEEANKQEMYWINYYQSNNPQYGAKYSYHSEATIQKLKDTWTKERREQQSDRMKKEWNENREKWLKILENNKQIAKKPDRTGENNPMYGKSRMHENAGNKKAVICVETGEVFITVIDAARWVGSESLKSHISAVCKGTRKAPVYIQ